MRKNSCLTVCAWRRAGRGDLEAAAHDAPSLLASRSAPDRRSGHLQGVSVLASAGVRGGAMLLWAGARRLQQGKLWAGALGWVQQDLVQRRNLVKGYAFGNRQRQDASARVSQRTPTSQLSERAQAPGASGVFPTVGEKVKKQSCQGRSATTALHAAAPPSASLFWNHSLLAMLVAIRDREIWVAGWSCQWAACWRWLPSCGSAWRSLRGV